MAFPVVETRATSIVSINNTSHAVTMPSGIAVGDLLVACIADGHSSATTSDGSGLWTKLGQTFGTGSSGCAGSVFYKVATGSDSLTVTTSSTTKSSHVTLRISGVSGSPNGTSVAFGDSNTNTDPPNHTPAGGAADYLWVAFRTGAAGASASAAPTNYSNLTSQVGAVGNGTVNTAERSLNASSENPGAFTSTSASGAVAWTIAVPPIAATSRPPVSRRPLIGALLDF